jgi:hypothetical protein
MSASDPAPIANTAEDPKACNSLIKTSSHVSLGSLALGISVHTQESHGVCPSRDDCAGNEQLKRITNVSCNIRCAEGSTYCIRDKVDDLERKNDKHSRNDR